MDSDILKTVQTYLDRNSAADYMQGEIKSIQGNVAYVKIQGGERYQEAWLGKNSGLTTGDVCVMVRLKQSSRWVVVNGYGTSYQGSDDTVAVQKGFASATYNADISSYTAWTQLLLLELNKASSESLLVVAAEIAVHKSIAGGPYKFGINWRFKVDGVEQLLVPSNYYGGTFYGYTNTYAIHRPLSSINAGSRNVSLDVMVASAGADTIAQIAFHAYEV